MCANRAFQIARAFEFPSPAASAHELIAKLAKLKSLSEIGICAAEFLSAAA
jgi:hypothetical protein